MTCLMDPMGAIFVANACCQWMYPTLFWRKKIDPSTLFAALRYCLLVSVYIMLFHQLLKIVGMLANTKSHGGSPEIVNTSITGNHDRYVVAVRSNMVRKHLNRPDWFSVFGTPVSSEVQVPVAIARLVFRCRNARRSFNMVFRAIRRMKKFAIVIATEGIM